MATVREHDYQVGVFAYTGSGEVVLVTNRKGHSWILPKGNREKKRSDRLQAKREAFEEAGLEGSLHYKHYDFQFYDKSKKLRIYSMKVKAMLNDFPEVRERKRMVTTFDRAEKMVKEEYLKIIQELRKRIF
ncbi:MAG: NUDIX domain-containing protein [Opitutae bacterium]|nr:NUDIX domain-containing protein [Opitutae bacterium]NBU86296.1 NUDIX domain-containing protein [Verrucomicrobiota bacterium]